MTEPAALRTRKGLPLAASVALAIVVAALVLLAALYAGRRQVARDAVTGWLKSRGVVSESQFEEIGPGRLAGRIRIGPAQAPDLVVERAEISYSLIGLLSGRGVQVTSVRLVRPVLRASWRGGRFSAGALDPLIAEFRKRPPSPGAPSPTLQIDRGRLLLATDYGGLDATVDARVENGRLVRLDAATAPTRLSGAGLAADLGPGALEARTAGGQLSLHLQAPLARLGAAQGELRGGQATLDVRGAYPDAGRPLAGEAQIALRAASARAGAASTGPLQIAAQVSDLRWTSADGASGRLRLTGNARGLSAAQLRLDGSGSFAGGFAIGRSASVRLTGAAEGRGGWSGLGGPAKGDSAQIVALKRGLRAFRISAQGLGVESDGHGLRARLGGGVRLLPAAGGEVRLAPQGGGYRLTSAGGGLPGIEADIGRVVLGRGGATADGQVKAALSIGPLQDAKFDAAGTLRIAGGGASFTASRCVQVTAARFDLGANDAEHVAMRLCPAGGPLLRLVKGGWSLAGRAEDAAARVPFLQAAVSQGAGAVRLADNGGQLSADLAITGARLRDAAPKERFRPLQISGRVGLARDLWTGGLDIRLPDGARVAHADLRHEVRSASGGVEIATGPLAFATGGLQPTDLSPIAKPLGSGVTGTASFTGGFHWSPAGPSSSGELKVPGLDFKSPIGAASGLSGDINFTSLAPLIAPPGQVLHVQRIAAALPLTDLTVTLALQEKSLVVSGGQAKAGGGQVRIERLEVPLEPGAPVRGVLQAQGVQLRDLVKASPFGDRVSLDAKVSGRIPFEIVDGKARVAGGELHAIAPGRLSINRAALTTVAATGSIQAPAQAGPVGSNDTFTDFAYQALENLAFEKLDAQVDSRPDGRLGVLFHIVGRHDPPQRQEITISWLDLIRRRFLGRKLPLPSDTAVDLTLDTTLNLDDLLKDYADFEQLRSSPPVQR